MHTAYCVSHGLVMFRDFWEFHGPLLAYLLAPVVKAIENPIDALFAARAVMVLPGIAMLVALWHASGDFVGHRARWLSILLLCSFTTFTARSMEIRPDVPAACLFFCALALSRKKIGLGGLFGVGALLGSAVFFTPKVVYPGVGLALAMAWEEFHRAGTSSRLLLRRAAAMSLGAVLPAMAVIAVFALKGALPEFYQGFILFNKSYPRLFPPWIFLGDMIRDNLGFWALALAGFWVCRRQVFLMMLTAATVMGLIILVLPYSQYYLFLAPLLSILASAALLRAWDVASDRRGLRAAGGVALVLLLIPPFMIQARSLRKDNAAQLEQIRCVLNNTGPSDRVFDTWSGVSFARPHAFFLWALPRDMQPRFDAAWLEKAISQLLVSPGCRALLWDREFEEWPMSVKTLARTHYHPAGCGVLYVRNKGE